MHLNFCVYAIPVFEQQRGGLATHGAMGGGVALGATGDLESLARRWNLSVFFVVPWLLTSHLAPRNHLPNHQKPTAQELAK